MGVRMCEANAFLGTAESGTAAATCSESGHDYMCHAASDGEKDGESDYESDSSSSSGEETSARIRRGKLNS